jgi:hypothetical protein
MMNICLWAFSVSIVKPLVGDGAGSQGQKEAPLELRRSSSGGRADVAVPKTLELLSLSVSYEKRRWAAIAPARLACMQEVSYL